VGPFSAAQSLANLNVGGGSGLPQDWTRVAIEPHTRVVTMRVACMAEDAEDVKRSLFDESGRCWYLDHHCPLGPIKVGIRLPTAVEEVAARDALDVDETGEEAGHA
jgi:hypothetical protein